jgi:hypothetical protein
MANARSIFVVVEEVDGVLLHVAALMVVSDNHADIFVPGCTSSEKLLVRHEVAISTVILGFREITLRSAASTLPRHALPATAGCEALGTI